MHTEHEYIELFKTQFMHTEGPVDPLHILVFGLSVDFVVNADVNVSLGCTFTYAAGFSHALRRLDQHQHHYLQGGALSRDSDKHFCTV